MARPMRSTFSVVTTSWLTRVSMRPSRSSLARRNSSNAPMKSSKASATSTALLAGVGLAMVVSTDRTSCLLGRGMRAKLRSACPRFMLG